MEYIDYRITVSSDLKGELHKVVIKLLSLWDILAY